jgi:hypothetical protein
MLSTQTMNNVKEEKENEEKISFWSIYHAADKKHVERTLEQKSCTEKQSKDLHGCIDPFLSDSHFATALDRQATTSQI